MNRSAVIAALVFCFATALPARATELASPGSAQDERCRSVQWQRRAPSPPEYYEPSVQLAPVDYDEDGTLDLVGVLQSFPGFAKLVWWKGKGDGTFDRMSVILDRWNYVGSNIVIADATGDGAPDVLTIIRRDFEKLLILPATGSAQRPVLIKSLGVEGARSITPIQLDFDLAVELVLNASGYGHNRLDVYDDIDTTPRRTLSLPTEMTPTGIAGADFDGDGHDDIAVAMRLLAERRLHLYFGKADGTFEPPVALPSIHPYHLVAGDFNEDGRPDFVASTDRQSPYSDTKRTAPASIYLNQGGRRFIRSEVSLAGLGRYDVSDALVLEDVSGDGHLDLVAGAVGIIATATGLGNGTFLTPTFLTSTSLGSTYWDAAGDFNEDGRPELAILGERLSLATSMCATQVVLKVLRSVPYSWEYDDYGTAISMGQEVALSVQISGFGPDLPLPLGMVTLWDGTVVLASSPVDADGKASFVVAGLGVGLHSLTLVFEGNSAVPAALSSVITQIVVSQPTEIMVRLPDTLPAYGGPALPIQVTMNAYGWPGIDLDMDGVSRGFDIEKPIHLRPEPGSHTVIATHHGSYYTPPGRSAPVTFTIAKGTPVLDMNSSFMLRESNDSVSLGVRGSGATRPGGLVQVIEGTTTVGSGVLVNGSAIVNVALSHGVHDLRAVYLGDSRYEPVTGNLQAEVLPNLPFPIEAQAKADGIRIAYILPANAVASLLQLQRRAAGTTEWTVVPGWNPVTGVDASVPKRGVAYEYRFLVTYKNASRSYSTIVSAALAQPRRRAVSP